VSNLVEPRAFTLRSDGGLLPALITDVSVCVAFDPQHTTIHPTNYKFQGIWDTGATGSVITQKVVDTCQLKPIGRTIVQHAQGEEQVDTFWVNFVLPSGVGISMLNVAKGVLGGSADVLIGMDVITKGDFALTHKDGKTCFSFRIPSQEEFDFTKNIPVHSPRKFGRNDLCPLDSKKKFKNCCGASGVKYCQKNNS